MGTLVVLRPSIVCCLLYFGICAGIQYILTVCFDQQIGIYTSAKAAEAMKNQTKRFQDSSSFLASGRAMQTSDRSAEAVRHFQQGIMILGDDYLGAGVIDDTPIKYLLAETQLRDKNIRQAASTLERVLETRLNLFAKKYRN